MNRIYNLVWNRRLGTLVVASELARGRRKGASGQCQAHQVQGSHGGMHTGRSTTAIGPDISGRFVSYAALASALILLGLSVPQASFASKDANLSGSGDGLTVGDNTSANDAGLTTLYWSNPNVVGLGLPIDYSDGLTVPGAVAIGNNAQASSKGSVVIGASSLADAPAANLGASTVIGAYSYAGDNNNVVIGNRSVATGFGAMALGREAASQGRNAVALGNVSSALGEGSLALGQSSLASGERAVAIGSSNSSRDYTNENTQAIGTDSLAFGTRAIATDSNSTAIGTDAMASSGLSAMAIGDRANASGNNAIALGTNAAATANLSISSGLNSEASGIYGVSIGANSVASGDYGASYGASAVASAYSATALGVDADALQQNGTAVGRRALANAEAGTAMGLGSQVQENATRGLAIGGATDQTSNASVDQSGTYVQAIDGIAIGTAALTAGERAVSLGREANAGGVDALAMGTGAVASGTQSLSIGAGNTVSGDGSGAIGDPSTITGDGSYSIGNDNTIDADAAGAFGNDNTLAATATASRIIGNNNDIDAADAFVLGNNADVSVANSVALGSNAVADGDALGDASFQPVDAEGNAIAVAGTNPVGEVSVGDTGSERRVTNVAAGSADTDAVNVSQLSAVDEKANYAAQGFNLSAQGGAATNIESGGEVNLRNSDGNVDVSQTTANGRQEVSFDLADDVTIGNSLTVTNGPTINGDGIDMGGDTISDVGDPETGGDAVNLDYFNANRSHYYSVNDNGTQGGNYDNDGATGVNSLAAGVDASANGDSGVALGSGATADNAASVALGSGATTTAAVGTGSATINGTSYDFAGTAPVGTVSVGSNGNERTLTNVAAGRVSDTSTDAINGSQLNATNQALDAATDIANNANQGFDLSAQDGAAATVTPGDEVNLRNSDGNVDVSQTTANGRQQVSFDLADDVTVGNSLTVNNGPTIDGNGIDMGGDTISNVGDPENGGDAVNLDYFNANRSHYYSVNDNGTQGGNYANDGATGSNAVAAGVNAVAAGKSSTAVGLGSSAKDRGSLALGSNTLADADYATALGSGSQAQGVQSIAVGYDAIATGSVAMGASSRAGNGGAAFGDGAVATYQNGQTNATTVAGTAVGQNASADFSGATAVGTNTSVTADNSVALGADSTADGSTLGDAAFQPTDAAGNPIAVAGISPAGEVSVGSDGNERRITNVAAGSGDTDAVNVSQLAAVDSKADAAGQGWNLTAQGVNETTVEPGDSVDLSNTDGNLVVAKGANSNDVTFALADDVTLGNSLTVNNGPTIDGDGIDMGGDTIRNVGAPQNDGDAVNLDYFNANRSHYYSVNDAGTQDDNYANDGATGVNAIASGVNASATTNGSVALGSNSVADRAPIPDAGELQTIPSSSATVRYNTTDKQLLGAVSVGDDDSYRQITNVADGTQAQDAVTIRQLQGAIGALSETGNKYFHANSDAPDSLAVGQESIAVGPTTVVNGDNGIGIGNHAVVEQTAPGGTAIGQDSHVTLPDGVALGTSADSSGEQAIAIGAGASAGNAGSVALGSNSETAQAVATTEGSVGGTTYAFAGGAPVGTVSVGNDTQTRTVTNVAAGRISADSTDAVNGSQLHATNQTVDSVESRVTTVEGDVNNLGDQVDDLDSQTVQYDSGDHDSITLDGDDGTTITNVADGDVSEGSSDVVNGGQLWQVQNEISNVTQGGTKYFKANSSAPDAQANGAESVAMGPQSRAEGSHSVATGAGAVASSDGGVALGSGSTATREGMDGAKEAFSNHRVASTQGAVSVGSDGGERQITHVAGGTKATDAVNVRQLSAVQAGSVNYDRNTDGSVDYSSVTLGQQGTPTQIHNVAPGTTGTDAANVGQLQQLGHHFNSAIGNVNRRIDRVKDEANAGTASAIAVASVPQAYLPGKGMVSLGVGTYNGESALAVGVSRLSDNGRWAVKLNGTANSENSFGGGVGVGVHW